MFVNSTNFVAFHFCWKSPPNCGYPLGYLTCGLFRWGFSPTSTKDKIKLKYISVGQTSPYKPILYD